MTEKETVLCAVCYLKYEKSDTIILEGLKLDMLGIVFPNFTLPIPEKASICFNCDMELKYLFEFKSLSLENEDYLLDFKNHQTNAKIDLIEVLQKKCINEEHTLNDTYEVCRICIKMTTSACELTAVKDMLERCLPEMDLSLTVKVLFCEECIAKLERYFKFSIQCCLKIDKEHHALTTVQPNHSITIKEEVSDEDNLNSCSVPESKSNNDKGKEMTLERLLQSVKDENSKLLAACGIKNNDIVTNSPVSQDNFTKSDTSENNSDQQMFSSTVGNQSSSCWKSCYFCLYSTTSSLERHLMDVHPELESKWRVTLNSQSKNIPTAGTFEFEMKPSFVDKEKMNKNLDDNVIVIDNIENNELPNEKELKVENPNINVNTVPVQNGINNIGMVPFGQSSLNAGYIGVECATPLAYPHSIAIKSVENVDIVPTKNANTEDPEWNRCPYCPFSTQLSLSLHVSNRHPEHQYFKCPHCEFRYSWKTKNEFMDHLKNTHIKKKEPVQKDNKSSPKTIECPYCKRTIKAKNYKAHMVCHNTPEDTWPECPICPYRAFSFSSLKVHMLKSNHGDKELIDKVLEEALKKVSEREKAGEKHSLPKSSNSKRKVQAKSESKSKKTKAASPELKPEDNWPQCSLCPVRFSNKDTLKRHIAKQHPPSQKEEDWPKCPQCPYKTNNESSMMGHIRMSHPEPKHECTTCAFSHTDQKVVNEHINLKHPDKKLEESWPTCPECPYRSKLPASLKAHMLRHKNSNKKITN